MEANINYWAVLVAAISSFAIGALWYAPFLFGKVWQKAIGLSDEELKNANMGKTFGLAFVLGVMISFGMAMFFGEPIGLHQGAMYGAMTAIFFVIPSIGTLGLFEQHKLLLFLVNSGYKLVTYTVIGAIIGAW
ncbi:MAG: DUF1761 domain-containing protein [Bacteroidota bacterium]